MATRSNVRSVVADAQDKGREAVEEVSEVRDNVAVAIVGADAGTRLPARGDVGTLVTRRPLNGWLAQLSGAAGAELARAA
jgi:hypothetical protein